MRNAVYLKTQTVKLKRLFMGKCEIAIQDYRKNKCDDESQTGQAPSIVV